MSGYFPPQEGAQLKRIEDAVERLRFDVIQIKLTALGSGSTPGSGEGAPGMEVKEHWLAAQLQRFLFQVAELSKQLGGLQSGTDNRQKQVWRLPHDQRQLERQNVHDLRFRKKAIQDKLENIRVILGPVSL